MSADDELVERAARLLHAALRNGKETGFADAEEQRYYHAIARRVLALATAGDTGKAAAPDDDPHDGYTCEENEKLIEELCEEFNDASYYLARIGFYSTPESPKTLKQLIKEYGAAQRPWWRRSG